jgi:hypothetical protein
VKIDGVDKRLIELVCARLAAISSIIPMTIKVFWRGVPIGRIMKANGSQDRDLEFGSATTPWSRLLSTEPPE